jgi:hypothetical protein
VRYRIEGSNGRLFGTTGSAVHAVAFLEAARRQFGTARVIDMMTSTDVSENELRRQAARDEDESGQPRSHGCQGPLDIIACRAVGETGDEPAPENGESVSKLGTGAAAPEPTSSLPIAGRKSRSKEAAKRRGK